MIQVVVLGVVMSSCPTILPTPGQLGTPEVAPLPSAKAMSLNAEGKSAYRHEHFDIAVERYKQAFEVDPSMVSAEFNMACGLSRLHRDAEAIEHASNAIRQACVPWAREVFESADLAVLAGTPQWSSVEQVRKTSCLDWGAQASEGTFFVARNHPPVNLNGEGVLVLKLYQEVFSYQPSTGRYLQVTSEDGNVLAIAVAPDNRMLAYVTGTKLINARDTSSLLRGLAVRTLSLATMSLSRSSPLPKDIRKIDLAISPSGVVEVEYIDENNAHGFLRFDGERLDPIDKPTVPKRIPRTILTCAGVTPNELASRNGKCTYFLKDGKAANVPKITVFAGEKELFQIKARYGAGIRGITFPWVKSEGVISPDKSRSSAHTKNKK